MNWGRGLFRVWAVLSLIYVASVVGGMYGTLSEAFKDRAFLDGGVHRMPIDCKLATGEEGKDFVKEEDGPWLAYRKNKDRRNCFVPEARAREVLPQYAALAREDFADQLQRDAESGAESWPRPWPMLWRTLGFAFIPPVILLALGWALLWAARGFKSA